MSDGILRVRNVAQKVLWEEELSGQISDGHWENSGPNDHWQPWCNATIVVDPDHVGRNFWARRESYNFTAKDLLDVVGERMVEAVRLATGDATYDMTRMRADLNDLKKIIKQHVPTATPIPAQPKSRKAKLIVDGWPQNFTVYYACDDDPRAVEALRKRELEQGAYQLKQLRERAAKARREADKLENEANALDTKLQAMKDDHAATTLRALAVVKL